MGSIRTVPIDGEAAARLEGRTVVHLTYAGYPARFELITRRLPHLDVQLPARRWFFVDVPFADGGAITHGLEVVQLHRPDDQAVRSDLQAWLADCRSAGLIVAANFASAPLVLNAELFPGGQVPASYVNALASDSARAA